MINLLFILDFYDLQYKKDSGTPALRLIIEALAKKYTVHIIAPNGSGKDGNNIFYHRVNINPPSSRIGKKLFWFVFDIDAIHKAYQLNDQYKFKLIYGAGPISSFAAWELGWQLNIPTVGRLFGTYLAPFLNNTVSLFLRFEECLPFIVRCDKLVVTNDGTEGDTVADHFNVPKDRLCFWRNGVEVPPVIDKETSDTIRIISMARLEKWKRVDRIIKAFHEARVKNPNIVLDIVGGGPETPYLLDLIVRNNLAQRINLYGEVCRKDAMYLLSRADIFISTNDYSNLSNSLMEAMSCGKAVIALNTGGTSDVIQDGVNGYLVDTEEDLPNAILMACEKEYRTLIGAEAKKYAEKHFESWESRIEKEVKVCEELMK